MKLCSAVNCSVFFYVAAELFVVLYFGIIVAVLQFCSFKLLFNLCFFLFLTCYIMLCGWLCSF